MSMISRRDIVKQVICFCLTGLHATFVFGGENSDRDVGVIKLVAGRFEYTPSVVNVNKNEAVTIEITSKDVMHGFYIPALNIRADIVPGNAVQVKVPGLVEGIYPFVCDIFCGEGHTSMSGKIIVR